MKGIVTGGSGLIGRSLVSELLHRGWEVDCLGRGAGSARAGVRYLRADLLDLQAVSNALRDSGGASVLFHLAAALPHHVPPPDAETYLRANVLSSLHLFEQAQLLGVGRVVHASSMSVIGVPTRLPITESHPLCPLSSYAISKLASEFHAERLRRTRDLNVASLRISSVYGPGMSGDSVLPRFVRCALDGSDLAWFGSGARTQNFVHVEDVTRALLLAAVAGARGVFTVGGERSIGMRALAELVVRLVPGTSSAARPAGRLDPQDDERWELDLGRARTELGYVPSVPLEEGLARYIASLADRKDAACGSR